MTRVVQHRRGTTTSLSTILGAPGEIFVDTSLVTIVVQDGINTGGTVLARNADLTNLTSSTNSSIAYLSSVAATKATTSVQGIVRGDNTSIVTVNGIASLGSSLTASWTFQQSSNGSLIFYFGGSARLSIDSSGTITALGNVRAFTTPG